MLTHETINCIACYSMSFPELMREIREAELRAEREKAKRLLIQTRIENALSGMYMPTPQHLLGLIYPSDAEVTEFILSRKTI